jgi:hypothetical protein
MIYTRTMYVTTSKNSQANKIKNFFPQFLFRRVWVCWTLLYVARLFILETSEFEPKAAQTLGALTNSLQVKPI